jgi:lipopolysaccharide export system ATP-binding protein
MQAQRLKLGQFRLGGVHHQTVPYPCWRGCGERRRVEIARALAAEPAFILLDEPFAGVDPISVADIMAIIRQLKERGIGVLITDHNVRETLAICEKAYIVGGGHIIAEGTAEEILANQQVKDVYLGHDFKL